MKLLIERMSPLSVLGQLPRAGLRVEALLWVLLQLHCADAQLVLVGGVGLIAMIQDLHNTRDWQCCAVVGSQQQQCN